MKKILLGLCILLTSCFEKQNQNETKSDLENQAKKWHWFELTDPQDKKVFRCVTSAPESNTVVIPLWCREK